jgi:cell division protein FtsN
MEKKKLLIVAVSVGVVLLIIIAIPLMMITSQQNNALPVTQDWVTVVEPGIRPAEPVAEPAPVVQPVESVLPKPEEPAQITLTVPVPQTAAVPDTPVTSTRPVAVRTTAPVAAAPAKPAAKPAPAPKAAAKPADQSKTNSYWVQTGAFSTKIRAEGAKESLASKGITSIIDNRDIDGKTWYRVRVGPYTSENEANYWLALVKSIDGFADSQVRLSQVLR